MLDRIESFVNLKKAAYVIAKERGFFKMGIEKYDVSLNLKERQITEHIIRGTWDFHKVNNIHITDGQETRLIMHNCIYSGMYAEKYLNKEAEEILKLFDKNGITQIELYVTKDLCFSSMEFAVTSATAKAIAQDAFNNNISLYPNWKSDVNVQWDYYRDFACVMFEIGAMYYENRKDNAIPNYPPLF